MEETKSLRETYLNILLSFDGYGANCSYKVLLLLQGNHVFVIGLPAHTSHCPQPLNFNVFSPYKTAFRNDLKKGTIVVRDGDKNDMYTFCELLTNA